MILITGATGHLGKATINFLLKSIPANQIAGLVRDENKATDLKQQGITVRVGDYDNKTSLVAAFQNIDKLFFISGSDVLKRIQQHTNVVEAAKEAGVKHIIYTSFTRKNESETNPLGILATSHIETDQLIKASGIPFTLLLNNIYADVLPMFFGKNVLETGIYLPAGNGRAAYITRNDIALAAANVLSGSGHEGKSYVVANTENYTMQDIAAILSELSGQQIPYNSPSKEEYTNALTAAGVPQDIVAMLASFSEAIKQGEFETTASDIEKLLGRKPLTLKEFFKKAYYNN